MHLLETPEHWFGIPELNWLRNTHGAVPYQDEFKRTSITAVMTSSTSVTWPLTKLRKFYSTSSATGDWLKIKAMLLSHLYFSMLLYNVSGSSVICTLAFCYTMLVGSQLKLLIQGARYVSFQLRWLKLAVASRLWLIDVSNKISLAFIHCKLTRNRKKASF